MSRNFKRRIDQALGRPQLSAALGRFSEEYVINRAEVFGGIDFEALREEIARIKSEAAGRLDELADRFEREAISKGAKVFRTDDPAEVKKYILDLAQANGVKRIIKSKSMATEEIELNPFLEEAGLEVRESDLGELIIQLCGHKPSHMVLPAIHLNKEEVAGIFSQELRDEAVESDISTLVRVAREELRDEFLGADMGISGANIAVSETGGIVLVTNEGDGRLVTTLPPIHVAVVGVEKLVERVADVAPILKALPRSATCQLLTSYVSMITGPSPNTDGSVKNLHIILMDNRRSEMASDPVFKEALQCIRCAACLNVCPVYRLVGGHVFGDVYTGGIGTILVAWFKAFKESAKYQGLCIQCGRCREFCPAKIDVPKLVLELRRRLAEESGRPRLRKAMYSIVNNRPLFHSLLQMASKVQKPVAESGFIRHLPLFLSEATEVRSLPAIADSPFRDRFKKLDQPKSDRKAIFFAGCLIDFVYPEMGEALVRVLNRAGVEVIFPGQQTCCGAPARYMGDLEAAGKSAVANIEALLSTPGSWVVSACPTCTAALRRDFAATLDGLGWNRSLDRARDLAARTYDFSSLVTELVEEGGLSIDEDAERELVTYHDSCHLKRTLQAEGPPRELLERAGFPIAEMFESDMCCGMGGSYTLKFPQISSRILGRKLDNIQATGATVVAMDCPGCLMQIRGGLDKAGDEPRRIKARHTAELLADLLVNPHYS